MREKGEGRREKAICMINTSHNHIMQLIEMANACYSLKILEAARITENIVNALILNRWMGVGSSRSKLVTQIFILLLSNRYQVGYIILC